MLDHTELREEPARSGDIVFVWIPGIVMAALFLLVPPLVRLALFILACAIAKRYISSVGLPLIVEAKRRGMSLRR
jgi:hypothetical protein